MTRPIPPLVAIDLWPGPETTDPTVEPTSRYVETFWCPILGPTCIVAARRLYLRAKTGRYGQPLDELALELGLRTQDGQGSVPTIRHSLSRMCDFGVARFDQGETVYWLRSAWPLLNARQTDRLPARMRRLARPPEQLQQTG